jgi:hypothetical protein
MVKEVECDDGIGGANRFGVFLKIITRFAKAMESKEQIFTITKNLIG